MLAESGGRFKQYFRARKYAHAFNGRNLFLM
ncbi:hypothetical protein HCH_04704 [Hahella chejuensis KCTC 2396]|uniref:Uncharacterized protein n=1 Tax=Hahella chejuensis (strain KCTC 2396) TaxID=349521 RepID=Q2SD72_HAHCH|nr:hypothetical protein HCH_04704 [Hahella chejuensis KCTC 2396]